MLLLSGDNRKIYKEFFVGFFMIETSVEFAKRFAERPENGDVVNGYLRYEGRWWSNCGDGLGPDVSMPGEFSPYDSAKNR